MSDQATQFVNKLFATISRRQYAVSIYKNNPPCRCSGTREISVYKTYGDLEPFGLCDNCNRAIHFDAKTKEKINSAPTSFTYTKCEEPPLMKKFYISFGQIHVHVIDHRTVDKDCIVQVDAIDMGLARKKAFELFGDKFFTVYNELPKMKYFPRGIIEL